MFTYPQFPPPQDTLDQLSNNCKLYYYYYYSMHDKKHILIFFYKNHVFCGIYNCFQNIQQICIIRAVFRERAQLGTCLEVAFLRGRNTTKQYQYKKFNEKYNNNKGILFNNSFVFLILEKLYGPLVVLLSPGKRMASFFKINFQIYINWNA